MSKTMFAGALLATAACATTRSPQVYRADTQKLLDTRTGQLTTCYEEALKKNPELGGVVAVRFVIEKKTGTFTQVGIDPATSQTTEPLTVCVLTAIEGLKLEPPDGNEGRASFVYVLRPAAPAS